MEGRVRHTSRRPLYARERATVSTCDSGNPSGCTDDSQVVDRMTTREPYAASTDKDSWLTLDSNCHAQSCKLPSCNGTHRGWVESKLIAKTKVVPSKVHIYIGEVAQVVPDRELRGSVSSKKESDLSPELRGRKSGRRPSYYRNGRSTTACFD